jgi:hypothetical protein
MMMGKKAAFKVIIAVCQINSRVVEFVKVSRCGQRERHLPDEAEDSPMQI